MLLLQKYIFNGLVNIAGEHNVNHILEGSNIDDDSQFRPGKKAIEELNQDFRDSQGEASRMAAIMDSGLGGSLRKLLSQLEGLAIQIGEKLVPIFSDIIGFVSGVINKFTSLDENTKNIADL